MKISFSKGHEESTKTIHIKIKKQIYYIMIVKRNTKLQKIIIFCNCNLKLLLQLFARCSFSYVISDLLHDGGPYHIETSQSFCKKSR